jgi:antitoxin VapB
MKRGPVHDSVAQRHVRLFRNGRNQALRIPREFELPGNKAVIRKEGERLIVEPVRKRSLLAPLATLEPIEEAFAGADEGLPPLLLPGEKPRQSPMTFKAAAPNPN